MGFSFFDGSWFIRSMSCDGRRLLVLSMMVSVLYLWGTPCPADATPRDPMQPNLSDEDIEIEAIGAYEEQTAPDLPAPASVFSDDPSDDQPSISPVFYRLIQYISHYNRHLTPPQTRYIARAILQFSYHYGIDYRMVAGVIAIESSFRPDAISRSGAIGLGQLKPDTARWLGVADPYHPADNIAGTSRYLKYLLDKYQGNMTKALAAYYQGPGTIDRQGLTPQSQPYLSKFMTAFQAF